MAIPTDDSSEEQGMETGFDSKLTLDITDNDTFDDANVGDRNVCISVWGTVRSNDGSTLILDVEKAELMPEDYGSDDSDSEDEEDQSDTGAAPKHVVAIMIGKPKGK